MDKKEKQVSSYITDNGSLVEMIYRPDSKETRLVTYEDEKFKFWEKIELDDCILVPYPPDMKLIEKKVVLFPSNIEEYNSEIELIMEIRNFIHKYLSISETFEVICVYYVLLSYLYDKLSNILYLRFIGDAGTGKSRALNVIGRICYKPMRISGAVTSSSMFRIIDKFRGTLVLDESDFENSDVYSEITKILNLGYEKENCVLRMEGDNKKNWDIIPFECYCPKVIASRKDFQDNALESRCLTEIMDNTGLRDIKLHLPNSFGDEARVLRNKLLCFRFKNYNNQLEYEVDLDKNIEPRLRQLISIILSIIKDGKAKRDIIDFIVEYNKQMISDRALGYETKIVEALFNLRSAEIITIKALAEEYKKIREDEKELTNSAIGKILKKRLLITTRHSREGRYVHESNKSRLNILYTKYGFDVKDVKDVNLSGGIENKQDSLIKDIPL